MYGKLRLKIGFTSEYGTCHVLNSVQLEHVNNFSDWLTAKSNYDSQN